MLKDRGSRKNDVGMARGGGPDGVRHDHRVGLLPGAGELVRVGLMREGIAARPHDELHFRIGDLAAVEVDRLSGVEEAFDEAGDRNHLTALPRESGGLQRLDGARNAAEEGAVGRGRAAARVLIVRADAAARKSDLAESCGKRKAHPVGLFAVLCALNAPTHHDHGAVLAELVGELADDVGLDAGFSFGPFGRLFDAVRAAHDVVQEFLVTGCVLFKESHIGFAGFHEFLNHAEHHGAVRARTGRNPFGSKVFARVGGDRID